MQKATSLEYEPSSEPQDAPGVEDGDSHASDDPYGPDQQHAAAKDPADGENIIWKGN